MMAMQPLCKDREDLMRLKSPREEKSDSVFCLPSESLRYDVTGRASSSGPFYLCSVICPVSFLPRTIKASLSYALDRLVELLVNHIEILLNIVELLLYLIE